MRHTNGENLSPHMGGIRQQHRMRTCARTVTVIVVALLVLTATATVAGGTTGAEAKPCGSGQTRAPGTTDVCVAKGNATATQLVAAVQDLMATKPINGVVFGVWIDGKPIVTGALGEALNGVPATRQDHVRIGNAAEAMETTLFLRLVDQGKLSLDDPVSKWYPQYPNADKVTLRMLASSTSGYPDFVTSQEFVTKFDADPFRFWTPEETLDIAMKLPMVFEPGTSWAFSDTNFVLLGQVITKAMGTPYEQLIKTQVYDKVGMPDTTYSTGPLIPEPTLHSYSNERGVYEEATYWSPSWVTYGATATSTLDDLARFSADWGKGTLLTKQSHELQIGPANVGKGPLTADRYYAHGRGVLERLDAHEPADGRVQRRDQLLPAEEGGGRRVGDVPPGWRRHRAVRGNRVQQDGGDHRS